MTGSVSRQMTWRSIGPAIRVDATRWTQASMSTSSKAKISAAPATNTRKPPARLSSFNRGRAISHPMTAAAVSPARPDRDSVSKAASAITTRARPVQAPPERPSTSIWFRHPRDSARWMRQCATR